MKTKRMLFGTLAGTVTMFLLGGLIFGMLLGSYMSENTNTAIARPMDQMNVISMLLSNVLWALILTLILEWTGWWTVSAGLKTGVIVGCLANLSFDLTMHSISTLYTGGPTVIVVDTIAFGVLTGVSGSVIGWVTGKVSAEKTAVA